MSNYFQTLNRLEREKSTARAASEILADDAELVEQIATTPEEPASAAPARSQRQSAALDKIVSAKPSTVRPRPVTAKQPAPSRKIRKQSLLDARSSSGQEGHQPFVTLFDNLRAMADGGPVRTIVLAGASGGDRASYIATGLSTLARRRGLRVLVADVEEGMKHMVLRPRNPGLRDAAPGSGRRNAAAAAPSNERHTSALALDLRGGPVQTDLQQWFDSAAVAHDLVIIEAPPLGQSLDGPLLARVCDGLIIVVDSEVTTRESLRVAVERTQAVGCRILGLVMNGTREHLPGWMNRMTGTVHNG